jgi:site-specific DNA-methyltransferase (adenine-specific)
LAGLFVADCLTGLAAHVGQAQADLIYADPPFNSGHAYFSTGQKTAGPSFDDIWRWDAPGFDAARADCPPRLRTALDALHTLYGDSADSAYLAFLAPRLAAMHAALKPTGALYLHCDTRMSHTLRVLLDALFGRAHFHNEVVWTYRTGGVGKRHWPRKHDALLYYTVSKHYTYHPQHERIRYAKPFFSAKRDAEGWYADVHIRDVWDIPAVINVSAERSGYPTQKPLALLERVVLASSNPGDLIVDPFCGSGTTLVAAEKHGRRAIGLDINPDAIAVAASRLA